jgi:hypothetical protein
MSEQLTNVKRLYVFAVFQKFRTRNFTCQLVAPISLAALSLRERGLSKTVHRVQQ